MGRLIQHRQIATLGALWAKPETPHEYDEEFEGDGSLPTGWSESLTPSGTIDPYASFTTGGHRRDINGWRKSCYAIQPDTDTSGGMWLSRGITVPTNLFVWARGAFSYRYNVGNSNDASIGLILSATSGGYPDTSNRISFYMQESDGNDVQFQVVTTTGGSNVSYRTSAERGILGAGQRYEFFGIQKIGTTFHYWAFTGNGQMFHFGSTTSSITFDRAGFYFLNTVTTAPGNSIMTADFIRFKENAVFLPGYGN